MQRSIRSALLIALAVAGTLGCQVVIADQKCTETAPRQATLAASGADRLVIDVGAGSLEVRGTAGGDELHIEGEACASSTELLEEIRLETEERGGTLYVTARMPERLRGGRAQLDLVIAAPSGFAVSIEDGSGPVVARGVAALEIDDGSGSIDVADVAGDVRIEDGSGTTEVVGVGGSVRVKDGSGTITVTGVTGSVELEDGSGEIEIADVDGGVTVTEDGSGAISIARVGRDVLVEEDGSGSIDVETVGGDFTVLRDGSGGVRHADVRGRVSLP